MARRTTPHLRPSAKRPAGRRASGAGSFSRTTTLVDEIQAAYGVYDGIIINPAAYTHTSVAILDALKAVAIPAVEVHLSDVRQREDFRQISYARLACVKTYMGLGFEGYRQAILFLKDYLHTHTV